MAFEKMTMSDGAQVDVYRALPLRERRGGLVLIQEIFGVSEHIRELCDHYAADGYEVLSPALFDREHPGFEASYDGEGLARAVQLARELHPFDLSMADTKTCVDALKDKGPVFITGYCYGGSIAFLAACRIEGLAAASGYYGSLIKNFPTEHPRCPTILHFGRFDTGISIADVDAVEEAQPDVTVYVYEAGHGFNSDRRKDFHEPSAELARERTLALFRQNGG
ncbi:dienelactone hydrolase family protein [Sphingomonas sp.]|uniref:dienelactone hydrolase family protein n=1 Tax=Sphingomonas sp. TaxID=28214 RepID=UPI0025D58AB8|nr:dienelactone hydrolase family protein [Sphingomonas sp.]